MGVPRGVQGDSCKEIPQNRTFIDLSFLDREYTEKVRQVLQGQSVRHQRLVHHEDPDRPRRRDQEDQDPRLADSRSKSLNPASDPSSPEPLPADRRSLILFEQGRMECYGEFDLE